MPGFRRKKTTTKRPKQPKIRGAKVPSIRQLMSLTIAEMKQNWRAYMLVLAVVAVPSDILSQVLSLADNNLTAAYLSCAAVIMNVALLWTIARYHDQGDVPTVDAAYYDGSLAIVRYALTSVLLVAMLVPFAFGAALYSTGLVTTTSSGLNGGVLLVIGIASLIIALPSFYLIIRYSLSTYAVVQDGFRPLAALRRSRRLTLGRFWPVAGRLIFLAVIIGCILIPIGSFTLVLSLIHLGSTGTTIFEILTTLIGLPVVNVYLFHLYRALRDSTDPHVLETGQLAETQA